MKRLALLLVILWPQMVFAQAGTSRYFGFAVVFAAQARNWNFSKTNKCDQGTVIFKLTPTKQEAI